MGLDWACYMVAVAGSFPTQRKLRSVGTRKIPSGTGPWNPTLTSKNPTQDGPPSGVAGTSETTTWLGPPAAA